MKHALYRKFSMNAAKGLVASLMFALIVVGCASNPDSLPEESKLAEADLFDGLKDEAASVTTTSSEDPTAGLMPAEDSPKPEGEAAPSGENYSADNIVRSGGGSSGNVAYDYYYVAVGGESIGRLAKAIYNNRKSAKWIYNLNPDLKGATQVAADQKVYFDMRKANPRAEYLTKDMIERYKEMLRDKIQARRAQADGNSMLSQTTIGKGETLQVVSQRLYGTTRLWTELFLLNQQKIGNFDNLKVGTVIDYYPVSDFMGGGSLAKADSSPTPSGGSSGGVSQPAPEAAPGVQPEPAPAVAAAEAQPAAAPGDLPNSVKVTEKPSADSGDPVVKGGIPVESGEIAASDGGPARNANAPPPGGDVAAAGSTESALPDNAKRIRPPAQPDPSVLAEADADEGFLSRNFRRFVYIGFIALIVAGGYYLTRPNRGGKNKFSGIQPMPNPMAGTQPAPRPRVMPSASPNRVTVNRQGAPPTNNQGGQKTG